MATTRKTKNNQTTPQGVTEGAVRDLATEIVREAIRTTSRELEQHLNDINTRLVALEKATRK